MSNLQTVFSLISALLITAAGHSQSVTPVNLRFDFPEPFIAHYTLIGAYVYHIEDSPPGSGRYAYWFNGILSDGSIRSSELNVADVFYGDPGFDILVYLQAYSGNSIYVGAPTNIVYSQFGTVPTSSIPEPSTYAVAGGFFAFVVAAMWRIRRKRFARVEQPKRRQKQAAKEAAKGVMAEWR